MAEKEKNQEVKKTKKKKPLLWIGLAVLALTLIGGGIPAFMGIITVARDIIVTGIAAEAAIVAGGVTNAVISSIKNRNAAKANENTLSRKRTRGLEQEQNQVISLGEEKIDTQTEEKNPQTYTVPQSSNKSQNKSSQKK